MSERSKHAAETLDALLLHDKMEKTAAYLSRGRSLEGLGDEALKAGWTGAWKAWFRSRTDADYKVLENHEGELALRDIEHPSDTIAAEMEEAREEIARDAPGNPGIRDAIRRFMEAKDNEH